MTNFARISTWADRKHIHAVVETPRGSRAKFEFDPKLKAFTLSKPLLMSLTYSYDWGFIPATKADNGNPLDALIIHDAATYPGLVLKCRPIGVLEIVQQSKGKCERNDRLVLIPCPIGTSKLTHHVRSLSKHTKQELQKFFEAPDVRGEVTEGGGLLVVPFRLFGLNLLLLLPDGRGRFNLRGTLQMACRKYSKGCRRLRVPGLARHL